jgi:hypothetical protein
VEEEAGEAEAGPDPGREEAAGGRGGCRGVAVTGGAGAGIAGHVGGRESPYVWNKRNWLVLRPNAVARRWRTSREAMVMRARRCAARERKW